MSRFLAKIFYLLLPLIPLQASLTDQLLVLFGANGYILYKVLDFANDHGFRYVKILSYEFTGFEHEVSGRTSHHSKEGKKFEITDNFSKISFICYQKLPTDTLAIEVNKYLSILEQVEALQDL